ncbi:glycosyltransferase family 2 protein [Pyrococcus abyssi]|uniref:Dolichyl-phosphate mannose synthase n=1 Tax=Pyrococcus abyssi (strain GE5 / Orsay) TaxID=272844 RepID=Q9V152_PYRAB|nr:glycosyltransferase family 2 protein [Pyrococcus abyssi]CAB49499.1 Glycosyltransferase [Pyrococcus abyssi GE5]CCE69969.1 TPA: dolichyl-phosphate mannose synthase [Pyrococcus abyssi GE5]
MRLDKVRVENENDKELIAFINSLGIEINENALPIIGRYYVEILGTRYEAESFDELKSLVGRLMKTYIVMPAYNEEKTIGDVLDSLLRVFPRENIIVVDDGSRDRTREIAKSKGVHVVSHIINRGLGGALGTGIRYAVYKGAEIVVTFDADGQHIVEDALRVIKPVAEGKTDLAIGSRFKGNLNQMPLVKRVGNIALNLITAIFAFRYISDTQSGLRAFSRNCASRVKITCDGYAVSSEIIVEASRKKCRIVEIPITAVYTEYSMKKGTNVIEGIKIALNLFVDLFRR